MIHWHTVQFAVEDGPAWAAIERFADEAFRFGRQTEECERQLLEGQVNME